jgi:hypothetical protein
MLAILANAKDGRAASFYQHLDFSTYLDFSVCQSSLIAVPACRNGAAGDRLVTNLPHGFAE